MPHLDGSVQAGRQPRPATSAYVHGDLDGDGSPEPVRQSSGPPPRLCERVLTRAKFRQDGRELVGRGLVEKINKIRAKRALGDGGKGDLISPDRKMSRYDQVLSG
jgi:hypothetical protein